MLVAWASSCQKASGAAPSAWFAESDQLVASTHTESSALTLSCPIHPCSTFVLVVCGEQLGWLGSPRTLCCLASAAHPPLKLKPAGLLKLTQASMHCSSMGSHLNVGLGLSSALQE